MPRGVPNRKKSGGTGAGLPKRKVAPRKAAKPAVLEVASSSSSSSLSLDGNEAPQIISVASSVAESPINVADTSIIDSSGPTLDIFKAKELAILEADLLLKGELVLMQQEQRQRAKELHEAELAQLARRQFERNPVHDDEEGELPSHLATILSPFRYIPDKYLNAVYRNTHNAWNNIFLYNGHTWDDEDDGGLGIVGGRVKVKKTKGEASDYPSSEVWSNAFGSFKSVLIRLHGASHPNLEYSMEQFRVTILDYSKNWDWKRGVLPCAMRWQNLMRKDPLNAEAWKISDNELMLYCRSFPLGLPLKPTSKSTPPTTTTTTTHAPGTGKNNKQCHFENRSSGCINANCSWKHSKGDKGVKKES